MKEILTNLFGAVQDRIKNRFIGSYIICFVVYNWWPISIFLFSNKIIEDKINFINAGYNRPSVFLVPLIVSSFYIALLPYLNAFFDLIVTKANFFRIKNKSQIRLESLTQSVAIARKEREIAEERAGTKELENLRAKLELKENELLEFSNNQTEIESRFNTENKRLFDEIGEKEIELREVRTNLENFYSELDHYRTIYPMFIKEGATAQILIEKFLKSYLNDDEIIRLKEAADNDSSFKQMPFRQDVSSLLIKINHFEYNPDNNSFEITEAGVNFAIDKI